MKELRIVFMGTPEFAVASLDKLHTNGYTVCGVITAPDKPAGRGRKIQQSAVKEYAVAKGLKVLQPTNLKAPEFLEALEALGANLQVVVAFRMLPREVWSMPEYGTFNLHASLLPDYRGAAPINWAVMNGESVTGVTTFYINDKIDTGAILLQEEISVGTDETAGMVHDKLMELGAGLVLQTVKRIGEGKVEARPQKETTELKSAPKIHKDTCKIEWNRPVSAIYNHIRGLSPYPGAWSTLHNDGDETLVKIFMARPAPGAHNLKPGSVRADKETMKVAGNDGFLELGEIQLAGKRRMNVKEVLNGLSLDKHAHLG